MLGSFWTVANFLSIVRVPLSIAVAILVVTDGPIVWSLSLILIAGLTDWLDGLIARLTNTVSGWGKILDPLADKISVTVVAIAFLSAELLPFWFVCTIVLRDLLIAGGGVLLTHKLGRIRMSNFIGKATTTGIAITFLLALLKPDAVVLYSSIYGSLGLLILSLFIYAIRLKDLRNNPAQR
ncbi:MAG: CDP-alcohol phosphatidyltransferase family protein [Bacteroidetes bacterium]|nr:CDP-alcohol phosphatidyltransferase family protein [Bacteroidota bacterium]